MKLHEVTFWINENWQWFLTVLIIPFWKKIKNFFYYYYNKFPTRKRMFLLENNYKTVNSKLDKILNEFNPNGGESLKDQINRIEVRGIITQAMAWSMKELSNDGEFITDEDGNWIRVNKTFLKWVLKTEEDIKGDGWVSCIDELNRDYVKAQFQQAIEEKRSTDITIILRRDELIVINAKLSLNVMKSNNKIYGFYGTIKKIN